MIAVSGGFTGASWRFLPYNRLVFLAFSRGVSFSWWRGGWLGTNVPPPHLNSSSKRQGRVNGSLGAFKSQFTMRILRSTRRFVVPRGPPARHSVT